MHNNKTDMRNQTYTHSYCTYRKLELSECSQCGMEYGHLCLEYTQDTQQVDQVQRHANMHYDSTHIVFWHYSLRYLQ